MKLKKAILSVLGRDTLRAIADGLEVDGVDRRSASELAAALSRSRRSSPEAILEYLNEAEVKAACEAYGVSATGRRAALMKSLLKAEGTSARKRQAKHTRRISRTRPTSDEEFNNMDDASAPASEPEPIRLPDPPTGMIRVARTELVWSGKYNDDGTRKEVPRVSLPFQVIETINESRATREAKKDNQPTLFDVWEADEGDTFEDGWTNKLVWGDNLLVMGSLLTTFAGKIDLIYIDPPFATGADFTVTTTVGDGDDDIEVTKQQSIIEEKAYRDTWGQGLQSYLQMMYSRLSIMHELLSDKGSIFVHCDTRVNGHLRLLMDDLFGTSGFVNQITWRRTGAHNDPGRYGMIADTILFFSKGNERCWNQPYGERSEAAIETSFCYAEKPDGSYVRLSKGQELPSDWRRFQSVTLRSPHPRPNLTYDYKGYKPHRNGWSVNPARMEQYDRENRLLFPATKDGAIRLKMYLDESPGVPCQDIWTDVGKPRLTHNRATIQQQCGFTGRAVGLIKWSPVIHTDWLTVASGTVSDDGQILLSSNGGLLEWQPNGEVETLIESKGTIWNENLPGSRSSHAVLSLLVALGCNQFMDGHFYGVLKDDGWEWQISISPQPTKKESADQ